MNGAMYEGIRAIVRETLVEAIGAYLHTIKHKEHVLLPFGDAENAEGREEFLEETTSTIAARIAESLEERTK